MHFPGWGSVEEDEAFGRWMQELEVGAQKLVKECDTEHTRRGGSSAIIAGAMMQLGDEGSHRDFSRPFPFLSTHML